MQYFHKGAGTPRITNSDKVAWKRQNVREKNFYLKQRYLGNQVTQVGLKLKIFAKILMSAYFEQVTSSRSSGKEKNAWG